MRLLQIVPMERSKIEAKRGETGPPAGALRSRAIARN
jgi:hypothetical protein